jgi:outer membrane protein assembly factor BamA
MGFAQHAILKLMIRNRPLPIRFGSGPLPAIIVAIFLLPACTITRNYQKNKPHTSKNTINVLGGDFTTEERNALKARLAGQLDDSIKVVKKDILFLLSILKRPRPYDSTYANSSARNMKASLLHLGYYAPNVEVAADTQVKARYSQVNVTYNVRPGPVTRIDTFSCQLNRADLQELAMQHFKHTYVKKGDPVSREKILAENIRMVELFRNNGYYKFTSDDLLMQGDTTIEALTRIGEDPFENIRLLEEASRKRDHPGIRLTLLINPAADTNRLKRYTIGSVRVYPDYQGPDFSNQIYKHDTARGYDLYYYKKLFNNNLILRNLHVKPGSLYSIADNNKTISSFNKTGAWQNVNVITRDSADKLNMILQLIPAKKFGFEANVEASYSVNSNTNNVTVGNPGNQLPLSANFSLQNRNLGKQGVKMTHAIRVGYEFNLNANRGGVNRQISSSEVSYTNTVSIPKLVYPLSYLDESKLAGYQSFISGNIGNINRIDLFKMFSLGLSMGWEFNINRNRILTIRPINVEYSNLYDKTAAFDSTLAQNPYLRYSYNTSLIIGASLGITQNVVNRKHPNRQYSITANIEESGALLYVLPLNTIGSFKRDLRQYIKWYVEYINTIRWEKTSFAWRAFAGFGVPIGASDSSLPFFKQYFGGGPNSMRGWPQRGIGPGSKPLTPYYNRTLNDRTGDVRLELNAEYRYNIFQIRPNSIVLKGAVFADAGNIWNFRNTRPGGGYDSLQFSLNPAQLYKQIGLTLGTGFRLDFDFFLLRFDLGFRFKRPDLTVNNGWQIPQITFNNLFKKGEIVPDPLNPGKTINDERYRIWRYENFNFTIGLSYPF